MEYTAYLKTLRALLFWTVLFHHAFVCSTSLTEDCIWRGSGLPRQEKPSVVSIETKCHLGELHWAEPFGGLRVTFNPRDVHADYKLCFTARHPGVRIYQEHLRSLTLLTGASENVSRDAVCVKSTAGQSLVLYLETQEDQKMTQLNYTVLVNGRKRPRNDRRKACRPCKYSVLLKSLCKGNFVVRGYIKTLFPVGDGQTEQANVIATEVIRQENYIFVKSSKTDNEYTASINVPSGCHWKETEDRLYLLTGNLKSGRGPVLQCHIKETAWLKVLKEDILHLCSVVQF